MIKSLWAKQEVTLNDAWVEAEDVADLRMNRWMVIAKRSVLLGGEWQYVPGIQSDMALFRRMRELDMMVMTQRRDGETWTLLAKIAQPMAKDWVRTLERETTLVKRRGS